LKTKPYHASFNRNKDEQDWQTKMGNDGKRRCNDKSDVTWENPGMTGLNGCNRRNEIN